MGRGGGDGVHLSMHWIGTPHERHHAFNQFGRDSVSLHPNVEAYSSGDTRTHTNARTPSKIDPSKK